MDKGKESILVSDINDILKRTEALKEEVQRSFQTIPDENIAKCVSLVGDMQKKIEEMETCLSRQQDDILDNLADNGKKINW